MHQEFDFYLTNGGEQDLVIGKVVFAIAGAEFTIADQASGQTITAGGAGRLIKVRFTPARLGAANIGLSIPSNDPADAPAGGLRPVAIDGQGFVPEPTVQFLLRTGAVTDHVQVGLWDQAWNPADGVLRNGAAEVDNFVDRDSRCFAIRVTDGEAAFRNAATVTVDWWTLRQLPQGIVEDHRPAVSSLTLRRVGGSVYESRGIMLVTDAVDAAQATHDGMGAVANADQADHRLRRITVDAGGLDHQVRARYTHALGIHASPVDTDVPVFRRGANDERQRILVHFVNVRDRALAAGGAPPMTDAELDPYAALMWAIYARAGIFLQIDCRQIDPPPECTGWANRLDPRLDPYDVDQSVDPGVAVALQEQSRSPFHIVPHPSQTALIQAAGVVPGEITLFFVANIYDLLTQSHAGGEAFYASQSAAPAQLAAAVIRLNEQLTAMNLASALFLEAQIAAGAADLTKQNWFLDVLDAARGAAELASDSDVCLQARAFWGLVKNAPRSTGVPTYRLRLQTLLATAKATLPYGAATLAGQMVAAHGCAFLATRSRLGDTNLAPAHELTHITTDLNNAADGHYDLENPQQAGTQVVGSELPGHIDGKNLMHRYALDAGAPGGVALPKRLWDTQATNAHRHPMLVIPAQVSAILANATYIRPY